MTEIKCPVCGSSDITTERNSNDDHGLRWSRDYICKNCHRRASVRGWFKLTLEEEKQKAKPAAAYLRRYQDWRTGKDERTMNEAGIEPKELAAAIDQILDFFDEKGGGE